jgi:hypothetical protein
MEGSNGANIVSINHSTADSPLQGSIQPSNSAVEEQNKLLRAELEALRVQYKQVCATAACLSGLRPGQNAWQASSNLIAALLL